MTDGIWLDVLIGAVLVALLAVLLVLTGGVPVRPRYFEALARQAGYEPGRTRPFYWGGKVLLAGAALLLLLAVEGTGAIILVVLLAIAGFFIPDLLLLQIRRRRQRRILGSLSFFLDLLVSLLRSGLNLEDAFRRTGRRGFEKSHPLAIEVEKISEEISAGKDRNAAFRSLADRTGIPDLHSLAASMELASRLGAPVADTIAAQADLQREKRVERGRQRIDRALMIGLIPVILCGFPLFIFLIAFPTFLEILETLRSIRYIMS